MRKVVVYQVTDDGAALPALDALLGESDRVRLGRMAHAPRRREFLLGRALMLTVLRRHHGNAGWHIERSARGRPCAVAGDRTVAAISLSHSNGVSLCASGAGPLLGCDLECVRERIDRSAARIHVGRPHPVFALAERRWIVAGDERRLRFLVLWTAKEAVAKAQGSSVFGLASLAADMSSLPGTVRDGDALVVGFARSGQRPALAVHVTVAALAVCAVAVEAEPLVAIERVALTVASLAGELGLARGEGPKP